MTFSNYNNFYNQTITPMFKLFLSLYLKYINYLVTKLTNQGLSTYLFSEMDLTIKILESLLLFRTYMIKQKSKNIFLDEIYFQQYYNKMDELYYKANKLITNNEITKYVAPRYRIKALELRLKFWQDDKFTRLNRIFKSKKKIHIQKIEDEDITPKHENFNSIIHQEAQKLYENVKNMKYQKAHESFSTFSKYYESKHFWLKRPNKLFSFIISTFNMFITYPKSISLITSILLVLTSLLSHTFTFNEEIVVICSLFLAFILLYYNLSNLLWKFFNTLVSSFIHLNFQKISYANILLTKTKTKESTLYSCLKIIGNFIAYSKNMIFIFYTYFYIKILHNFTQEVFFLHLKLHSYTI